MTTAPFVSVIMPCLNEERFIGACLDSILATQHPHDQMEVLVVDGMSSDRTRAIVEEYVARDPRVRLLDNVKHITPSALNVAIRAARGDIIVRMDAHVVYPPEYIPRSARSEEHTSELQSRPHLVCRLLL